MPTDILEHGFLLTRNQFDRNGKCVFEFWFKSGNSSIQVVVDDELPVCFISESDLSALTAQLDALGLTKYEIKSVPLTTFHFEPIVAIYSQSLRDYYQLRDVAERANIELLEHDIRPVDRYLMERFIKGGALITGANKVIANGYERIERARVKTQSVSVQFKTVSLDIECDETGYIYSIGLHAYDGNRELNYVIYNGFEVIKPDEIEDFVIWCADEKSVLNEFERLVALIDPDVIIGWNVVQFDFKVLVAAFSRNKLRWRLGKDGSEIDFKSGRENGARLYPDRVYAAGRVILDGIDVMKNATYQFDSFSLNYVSSELLGESKLINEGSGHAKLAEIKRQYKDEPNELAKYNLKDCQLVSQIFKQEKLLEYLTTRTVLTGLELERIGGSVAAFTNLYLPKAHRKGFVAPNLVDSSDYRHSPGGFVMDSKPGLHKDVLVFDFKSLYPSIIRTFNVDPIGLVKGLNDSDSIPGFRGGCFTREKSILSSMIDELWAARDEAKRNNNAIWSNAIKIIMNSFYGVLGSAGCRFYDTRLASSITMRGHWILNTSREWFEKKGVSVIYGDTDSIFIDISQSEYKASDGETLGKELNTWWTQKLENEFNLESKLEIEYESNFSPFFMPTLRGTEQGSKKRYAGLKRNGEKTSIVIKGLETVRSDWTDLAKEFQTKLFENVFSGKTCLPLVKDTIANLYSGMLDEKLYYKKRIKNQLSSYIKTTPPQIRAARIANEKLGFSKYRKGIKIQYYMSMNGPIAKDFKDNVIDYSHYVEKQLKPIAEAILSMYEPDTLNEFNQQMTLI